MEIQLSANTWIDNDVLNLSDHQVVELQRIASLPGFSGLLEPNLNQRRSRGPVVVTYLNGSRRVQMLLGVYRTMPWPQDQQFTQLHQRDVAISAQKLVILKALKSPFNQELGNSLEESTARVQRALQQVNAMETISPLNALEVAAVFIHHANLKLAFKVVEDIDEQTGARRHG